MAIPLRINKQLEKGEAYIAEPYKGKRYKIKKGFMLVNSKNYEKKING